MLNTVKCLCKPKGKQLNETLQFYYLILKQNQCIAKILLRFLCCEYSCNYKKYLLCQFFYLRKLRK